ncbi:MAG: threonine/serine dehydratase [Chloroflexota bacterium]
MPDDIVSLERMRAAREAIAGRVHRTPLLTSRTAADIAGQASGARPADDTLYVKAEHLQKTGSFKPRGMTARVLGLSDAERARGIITHSAGNAGQAYAYVGGAAGVRTIVVMPADAVPSKVAACRGYGAEVVLHGATVGDAFAEMERLRDERGLTFCHPFDDPDVIAGHASAGFEILEDLPDVDVVVVGIGGGGLISGIAGAIRETRPDVRVYGVEPTRSMAMSLALERGEIVRIQPTSIADGLGAPFAGRWTMAMCARYLEGIVLLDDATILSGMRFALERMKQVLEPAGAAALAAVLTGRIPIRDGERVCVVASGGNVDVTRLGEFIAAAEPLGAAPSPAPA